MIRLGPPLSVRLKLLVVNVGWLIGLEKTTVIWVTGVLVSAGVTFWTVTFVSVASMVQEVVAEPIPTSPRLSWTPAALTSSA